MTTARDNLCQILRLFLIDGLAMFTKVMLYRQKYEMRVSQKRSIEHTILPSAPHPSLCPHAKSFPVSKSFIPSLSASIKMPFSPCPLDSICNKHTLARHAPNEDSGSHLFGDHARVSGSRLRIIPGDNPDIRPDLPRLGFQHQELAKLAPETIRYSANSNEKLKDRVLIFKDTTERHETS